jgi:single-strand DNA-binding protein
MSNIISFVGVIERAAKVSQSADDRAVLDLLVSNSVGLGDKQQTICFHVVLRGKRANGDLKDYLTNGQQVFVSGEMSQNEYQDNDVKTMYEINANMIDIVGNPSGGKQLKQQAPRQPYQTPRKAYEELERMKTERLLNA